MSPTANESVKEAQNMEHHGSAAKYALIWVVLMVLTLLTVFTGRMHIPNWGLELALAIATTKGALVVLYFMHLSEHQGANRVVFTVSVFFVALLILGSVGDIGTRFRLTNPPGSAYSDVPVGEFMQANFPEETPRNMNGNARDGDGPASSH